VEIYQDILRYSLVILWVLPVALLIGVALFAIATPTVTLGGSVIRLFKVIRADRSKKIEIEVHDKVLTCSIDTDCPEGYVCVNGSCVQTQNR